MDPLLIQAAYEVILGEVLETSYLDEEDLRHKYPETMSVIDRAREER